MKLEMKGRGIPKELKVGPVGYNDRKDPLRENAQKMLRGEKVSKPFSPESASSPGNSKLTRGYKSGGHVKMGHRIPTDMHIPRETDGHMPKKTPQTRVKKMGGVMQGDRGPGPSKREAEVAVQGQKGPRLKHGGMPHKSVGGTLKKVGRFAVKQGINMGSKAVGAAAGAAATGVAGPVGGMVAKKLVTMGTKKVGTTLAKKAHILKKAFGGKVGKFAIKQGIGMGSKAVGKAVQGAAKGVVGKTGAKIAGHLAATGTKKLGNTIAKKTHILKKGGMAMEGCVKKKRAAAI